MSERTYEGGCHCGKVRYTVKLDLSQPVVSCNCSMCSRAGTLLAFAPISAFKLESGEDSLTNYQFTKRVIHHLFCKVCGIKSFGRGQGPAGEMAAINVRCLDGVDLEQLTVNQVDGKSF